LIYSVPEQNALQFYHILEYWLMSQKVDTRYRYQAIYEASNPKSKKEICLLEHKILSDLDL